MKRIFKITAIFLVVVVIFGCHEEPETVEPHAPTLIEPEDGAVFDTLLPENFIWSADGWKEEFYFYIAVGSVSDTLLISGDTSIEFTPLTGLDGTIDASYKWAVASIAEDEALWSDIYSFTISTMKYGPTLLSPDDSSEVYGQSLVFSWTSDRPADMYTLYILSDYLIFQNVSDTFYDLSSSEYSDLQAGDYTWYVTRHVNDWRFPSETRHFTITEPLDLDTTYFPFGLGYEWCYETHDWGWQDTEPYEWDKYDTITVKVIDSTFKGDTLIFLLNNSFYDTGNSAKILKDSIRIFDYFYVPRGITISVYEPDTLANYITIAYNGDTLHLEIDTYWPFSTTPEEESWRWTARLRNIGVIYQGEAYTGPYSYRYITFSLLTFNKGQDTVYKVD